MYGQPQMKVDRFEDYLAAVNYFGIAIKATNCDANMIVGTMVEQFGEDIVGHLFNQGFFLAPQQRN